MPTPRPHETEQFAAEFFVVSFLDLLGQRAALRKLDIDPGVPLTGDVLRRFEIDADASIGAVRRLQNLWNQFAAESDPQTAVMAVSPIQQQLIRTLARGSIECARFSDGLVPYARLRPDADHGPAFALWRVILTCGRLLLTHLSVGQPVRGGLDVGLAVEFGPKDIYGPALVSAYELESRAAGWPRIAVGQGLVRYLQWLSSGGHGGELSPFEAKLADQLLAMVGPDADGQLFLDFLGKAFLAHVKVERRIITQAYEFVVAQQEHFRAAGDDKLAKRYGQLREYFSKRRYVWG